MEPSRTLGTLAREEEGGKVGCLYWVYKDLHISVSPTHPLLPRAKS
jgi:hypothetical protein